MLWVGEAMIAAFNLDELRHNTSLLQGVVNRSPAGDRNESIRRSVNDECWRIIRVDEQQW